MTKRVPRWVPASLLLLVCATACSLMAPSDGELSGAGGSVGAGGAAARIGSDTASDAGSAGDAQTASEGGAAEAGAVGEASSAAGSGGGDDAIVPLPNGAAGASSAASDPLGPLLWLKADAALTLSAAVVQAWGDQSGHALDATQATVARQPKRVLPNAGKLPMVEFDGIDDELDLPRGFANFEAGLSLFAVVQESVVASCPAVLQLSSAPDVDDIDLDFDSVRANQEQPSHVTGEGSSASDVGRTFHYEVGAKFVAAPGDSFAPGTLVTLSIVHAPSGRVELRIGGLYVATVNMPLPRTIERSNNFLGRSLYTGCKAFHGRLGELMLYDRALSDGERSGVEQYLAERWQ